MKKIFAIILTMTILACLFVGCTIVSETPVDAQYIAAYSAMETVYEYKWDWYYGDYKYLPVFKMVNHPAVYKVQYEIIWSDGSKETRWREVDQATYEKARNEINEDEESEDAE